MNKLFLALLSLLSLTTAALAEEKPAVWQNPPPQPSDVEARLKYIETTLGIYRLSWSARVPKGYKAILRFHATGEKTAKLALTYDGNKLPQPLVPDIFVASAADPASKTSRTLTFGDSHDSATISVSGTMRVHVPETRTDKKFNLFEVYLPTSKAPQYWCEVEFIKAP